MRNVEKQRAYDKARYADRKEAIIARNKAMRERRRIELINLHGGCCSICGYDKCHAALEFHHVDPTTKSFVLNKRTMSKSWVSVLAEAEKCILVCANCHREIEYTEA